MNHLRPGHSLAMGGGRRLGVRSRSRQAAFTLVELLVVVGLIVVLAGAGALALAGRGGEGAALANAQNIVAGLVGATRAQAALHQTRARLVIYGQIPPAANVDASKYLRTLVVLREDPVGSNRWVATGTPITLPTSICVVPPAPVPANHLGSGVRWNNNVQTGPVSTLTIANGFSYRGTSTGNAQQYFGRQGQSGRVLYLEFDANGTVTSPVPGGATGNVLKIALTTAVLSGNTRPAFNNASAVRGLFIRRSGAISLVDSATGF